MHIYCKRYDGRDLGDSRLIPITLGDGGFRPAESTDILAGTVCATRQASLKRQRCYVSVLRASYRSARGI
jgi:hypothetical protein